MFAREAAPPYDPVPGFCPRLRPWALPMIVRGRRQQSIFVLASAGLAVALLSQSAWAQVSGQLTRAEIDEAIRVGTEAAMRAGLGVKVAPFRMYPVPRTAEQVQCSYRIYVGRLLR